MADVKITALTENTTPLGTDIAPMVDDPGGTPLTQKITLTNLLATGAVANSVLAGTGTGVASYSAAPRLVNIADSGGTNVITTSTTSPQLTLLGADGDVQIGSGTGQSSLNLNTTFSAGNVAQILARGTYAVLSNILNVNISGLTISNAGTYTFTAIGGSAVPVVAAGSSATMQGLNFSAGASLSGVASDTTVVRITAARVIAGLFSSTRALNVCTLMEGLEIGVPSLIGSTAGTVTTYVAANFLGVGSSNAARFSGSIYYGTKVIRGLGTTGITGNRWGHNIDDLSTGIASGKNVLGYSVDNFATAPTGGGVSFPFVYGTGAAPITRISYDGSLLVTQQTTVGAAVQTLTTVATNDDPIEVFTQGRVATTDATATVIETIAITASMTYMIETKVIARRTGGTGGTADDGATYWHSASYTTKTGTVTLLGAERSIMTDNEDQAGWTIAFNINATNVEIKVTGAANNNVTWHSHTRTYYVGT